MLVQANQYHVIDLSEIDQVKIGIDRESGAIVARAVKKSGSSTVLDLEMIQTVAIQITDILFNVANFKEFNE